MYCMQIDLKDMCGSKMHDPNPDDVTNRDVMPEKAYYIFMYPWHVLRQ